MRALLRPMKALIAMSGGVDSSVAALMMKNSGYECIGCMMKLFSDDGSEKSADSDRSCCSLESAEDARRVAAKLGIPFYVFNFAGEFREKIIEKFIDSYTRGRTPNPCIDCNRFMKFDRLYERARVLGCDTVATGHYARIERENGRFVLKKALDPQKDQSYVLYTLTEEQLSHTVFPLGSMSKAQTREIAAENGLNTASKPDSQDICFVPDGDYAAVIDRYRGNAAEPGDFIDRNGKILGRHKGIIHYTIGQRRGLGISSTEPLYVCGIDPVANAVVLGSDGDLFSREVYVRDFHWIASEPPAASFECLAKIRYRHAEQPCTVTVTDGGVRIVFNEPQRAITPGQSAVLYDGDTVLGGGEIG